MAIFLRDSKTSSCRPYMRIDPLLWVLFSSLLKLHTKEPARFCDICRTLHRTVAQGNTFVTLMCIFFRFCAFLVKQYTSCWTRISTFADRRKVEQLDKSWCFLYIGRHSAMLFKIWQIHIALGKKKFHLSCVWASMTRWYQFTNCPNVHKSANGIFFVKYSPNGRQASKSVESKMFTG